jgi:stromal membrane-associated protein
MSSKRDVSKEQNERHKRVLKTLLKMEENRFCADCHCRGPTWASTNLGVFVCLQCSGIHRSLGVHISVVRSTNLDTWLPEQISFIQRMDNMKANSYWEASLPRDFRRPKDTEQSKLERFIQEKYVSQNFRDRDMPPPTIKNYHDHPLTAVNTNTSTTTARPPTPSTPTASSSPASARAASARVAAPPANKPEPPAQMMADLLSLDDDPPAAAPPAPAAPPPVATSLAPGNANGWANFASASHSSSDPFTAPAATASASSDPYFAAPSPAPPAPAQKSEPNDPFSDFASAPSAGETVPVTSAAEEPHLSKPAANKMSNDDILALFDSAPASNSFGSGPLGQQPVGYGGGYGMQSGGPPPPAQQQQQYAVQNGNGYYGQQQGYAAMTPQQQAYFMQQQQQQMMMMQQQQAYMMQQQYGVGQGNGEFQGQQQPQYQQQYPQGYGGMSGPQGGMEWGYQAAQPAATTTAASPQSAAQHHFAEFASFQ